MENSGQLYLKSLTAEDHAPQWYIAQANGHQGPFSASELYEKILKNELTLAHYIWKKGLSKWTRIYEVKLFQSLLPSPPPKLTQPPSLSKTTRTIKSDSIKRNWYLYYHQSQFGPFSQSEIQHFLDIGKIHGQVHAWQEGLKDWKKLEQLSTSFEIPKHNPKATQFAPPPPSNSKKIPTQPKIKLSSKIKKSEPSLKTVELDLKLDPQDHRKTPRRPLVAKILMSNQTTVHTGICRDISIGGLQVLSEHIPGTVGTHLKMNISPSFTQSGPAIQAFVAEGVIVRILEDQRGFSFRFQSLSEPAQRAIESYLSLPE